ncbi:hypothetical protein EVAR_68492_1 [Eumeta japonica]|uniref:Uncharacterized protein n=1 Tax=Eumeta variegata TaxID=151549 RepID=A0A4C1ZW90_EUMVA|nr:hypothetical protein EVAR_68492_1 [Eumeta japonica]
MTFLIKEVTHPMPTLRAAAVSLLLGRISQWSGREIAASQAELLRPIVPLYRLFRALTRTLGSGETRQ